MLSQYITNKTVYDEIFLNALNGKTEEVAKQVKEHGGIDFAAAGFAASKQEDQLKIYQAQGASLNAIALGVAYAGNLTFLSTLPLPSFMLDQLVTVFAMRGHFRAVEKCIDLGANPEKAAFGYLLSERHDKVQDLHMRGITLSHLVLVLAISNKEAATTTLAQLITTAQTKKSSQPTNNTNETAAEANERAQFIQHLNNLVEGYTLTGNEDKLMKIFNHEEFSLQKTDLINHAARIAATIGRHTLVEKLMQMGAPTELIAVTYASAGFAKEATLLYSNEKNISVRLKMAIKIINEYKVKGFFLTKECAERIIRETEDSTLKRQLQTAAKSQQKTVEPLTLQSRIVSNGSVDEKIHFLYSKECKSGDEIDFSRHLISLRQLKLITGHLQEIACPRYLCCNFSNIKLDEASLSVLTDFIQSGLAPDGLILNLSHCDITDQGADMIINALETSYLPKQFKLLIQGNPISSNKLSLIEQLFNKDLNNKFIPSPLSKFSKNNIRTIFNLVSHETFHQHVNQFIKTKAKLMPAQENLFFAIYSNNLTRLKQLPFEPQDLLSPEDGLGALQYAALLKRTQILQYFYRQIRLALKSQPTWRDYGISLEIWRMVCRMVDETSKDRNAKPLFTSLFFAVQINDVSAVRTMLTADLIDLPDLNRPCGKAQLTPTAYAFENGHVELVKLFFAKGAKFDFIDTNKTNNPLLQVVRNGHIAMLKWVLAQYQRAETASDEEYYRLRPLIEAIKESCNKNDAGLNPLILSANLGKLTITKWILDSVSLNNDWTKEYILDYCVSGALTHANFLLAKKCIEMGRIKPLNGELHKAVEKIVLVATHLKLSSAETRDQHEESHRQGIDLVTLLLNRQSNPLQTIYPSTQSALDLVCNAKDFHPELIRLFFSKMMVIAHKPNRSYFDHTKEKFDIDRAHLFELAELALTHQSVNVLTFFLDLNLVKAQETDLDEKAIDLDREMQLLRKAIGINSLNMFQFLLLRYIERSKTTFHNGYQLELPTLTQPNTITPITYLLNLISKVTIRDDSPLTKAVLSLIATSAPQLLERIDLFNRIECLAYKLTTPTNKILGLPMTDLNKMQEVTMKESKINMENLTEMQETTAEESKTQREDLPQQLMTLCQEFMPDTAKTLFDALLKTKSIYQLNITMLGKRDREDTYPSEETCASELIKKSKH